MDTEVLFALQDELSRYKLSNQDKGLEYSKFKPDYIVTQKEITDIETVVVVYWAKIWLEFPGEYLFHFIVLRQVQTGLVAKFQRLGIFALSEKTEPKLAK